MTQSTLKIPLQQLGLFNINGSDDIISTAVQLKRQARGQPLTVGDRLSITTADGGINFTNRGQIVRESIELDANCPPRKWFNDYLSKKERKATSGVAPDANRREMKKVKVQGKGVVTIAASPSPEKLQKRMQRVRDEGGIERDGDTYSWVNPQSIANPLCSTKQRLVAVVPPSGDVEYRAVEVQQRAVLCPVSTGIPVKLAGWHRRYGFLAKTIRQYKAMQVAELVALLRKTGYGMGHMEHSDRRGGAFDFTQSGEEDREELAQHVHDAHTTIHLCLWGDNADLAGHDHAAFLWHVVYYEWQWESKEAFQLERPNLHMIARSGADRQSITQCIARLTEDFLLLEGVDVPVGRTFARVRVKYCLGDEHFLAPAAGLIGSGHAATSYSSITSTACRGAFKDWSRSFFSRHWTPADIVDRVRETGWVQLNLDELRKEELVALLRVMHSDAIDYDRIDSDPRSGGYTVGELRSVAKAAMQGACATPGWCVSNPDCLRETFTFERMRYARDGMHSSAHNIEHCCRFIQSKETEEVATEIKQNMLRIGCGEGSMMRCCDWRMVAAHHNMVFASCKPAHRELMRLCGHITKFVYLRPDDRTLASVFALGVLAMRWQSLIKRLCPQSATFKAINGVGHAAMFGRYFHFWSMEAVLQYRLNSHRNTITERHEAFFAGMKKILRLTSSNRVDQDHLLRAAERSQMEGIYKEMQHTSNAYDHEASKMSQVFDSSSKLADITLTHNEVASDDYLVLCCIFPDYVGSGSWFTVKDGSAAKEVMGRQVQEVVVRVTEGVGDGNAMLLSDMWEDIGSMKHLLQAKLSERIAIHALVGWVDRSNLLTAMNSNAGIRSWLPVQLQDTAADEGSGDGGQDDAMGDAMDGDSGDDSDGGSDDNEQGESGRHRPTPAPVVNIRRVDDAVEVQEEEQGGEGGEGEMQLDEASASAYRLFTLEAASGHPLLPGAAHDVELVMQYAALRKRAMLAGRSDADFDQYREKRTLLLAAGRRAFTGISHLRQYPLGDQEKDAVLQAFDLATALVTRLASGVLVPSSRPQYVINHIQRPGALWQRGQQQRDAAAARRTAPMRIQQQSIELAREQLATDADELQAHRARETELNHELAALKRKIRFKVKRIGENQSILAVAAAPQSQQ